MLNDLDPTESGCASEWRHGKFPQRTSKSVVQVNTLAKWNPLAIEGPNKRLRVESWVSRVRPNPIRQSRLPSRSWQSRSMTSRPRAA